MYYVWYSGSYYSITALCTEWYVSYEYHIYTIDEYGIYNIIEISILYSNVSYDMVATISYRKVALQSYGTAIISYHIICTVPYCTSYSTVRYIWYVWYVGRIWYQYGSTRLALVVLHASFFISPRLLLLSLSVSMNCATMLSASLSGILPLAFPIYPGKIIGLPLCVCF